jgi:glutamate-1-semialdehyde 2,1-aminomutase
MPEAPRTSGVVEESSTAYRAESSRSRAFYERALCVMPGGNTRHSVALSPYPVYLESGKGCRVRDVEGEERIDFLNNFTSLIHGHADPEVTAAAQARMALGSAFAGPTECDVELAELLVERVPAIDRVRFCNSGSEAVMLAVKAARAFTGRARIAKIEGAYHGICDYAQVSEASTEDNWGPADRPNSVPDPGSPASAAAEVVVMPWNDADACERLIEEHHRELAAILIDAIPLGLSLVAARPGFLERLRDAALRHGILFIGDEILNFRLGYHGAFHDLGIQPDITCLAKIIGGGFPVGAVGGRADVMEVFDHRKAGAVHHGGTYNGNPVTMAAGLVTMRKMTPEAYDRLNRLGDSLREQLASMLRGRGIDAQVLGRGSLFSVRLTRDELRDWRTISRHVRSEPIYGKLCHEMLGRGILMSQRGIVGSLSTPMGPAEIATFVDALDGALTALGRTA